MDLRRILIGIQDREIDIRFHDRTKFDVEVAEMITDYLILHGQIKNLAQKFIGFDKQKMNEFQQEYDKILDIQTHSKKRGRRNSGKSGKSSGTRKYRDIIEGRFDVADIVYIDRKDDPFTIFGKAADFSRKTMDIMKNQGYNDTCEAMM